MDEQNQTGQSAPTQPAGAQNVETSNDAKNMGVLCHLLGFFTSFVGPLVIWLIKKDQLPFVDHHGKEALNFQITLAIAFVVGGVTTAFCIGGIILLVAWLADLILSIMACVAASKGEYYKYPWCLRLIK
jgi:hypothetical protein